MRLLIDVENINEPRGVFGDCRTFRHDPSVGSEQQQGRGQDMTTTTLNMTEAEFVDLAGSPADTARDWFADIAGTMLDIKSMECWQERSGTTPKIEAELKMLDARLDRLMIECWPEIVKHVGMKEIRATLAWLGPA